MYHCWPLMIKPELLCGHCRNKISYSQHSILSILVN